MKIFNYKFLNKNMASIKVLVISDIHYSCTKDNKKLDEIIKHITKIKYDALFLVGDIIDATNVFSNKEASIKLLEFIKILGLNTPTFIAFGTHDFYHINYQKPFWKEEISNDVNNFKKDFFDKIKNLSGIYLESNKPIELKKGYTVSIINPTLDEAVNQKANYSFLKYLDASNTNILLCHYPNFVFYLHKEGLLSKIDLAISGHNHNGMTQIKYLPIEAFLNLIGHKNRGIITPDKVLKLSSTKNLRGCIKLDEKTTLIINPAFTSLAKCTGVLKKFNFLFYRGASIIEFGTD